MQSTISIQSVLKQTRSASHYISSLTDNQKKEVLQTLADLIAANEANILMENEKDLIRMDDGNPKKDRLRLTPTRIIGLLEGIDAVSNLPDPTYKVLLERTTSEGLNIQKISVPLGVVGIIYESRPNVTIDVVALCIRSGNAVVLRGGSDAIYSNTILVSLVHKALEKHLIPKEAVSLLPTDRSLVQEMLTADTYIDIIIPRGSQQLIDYVRQHATVPTIETGAGVCHTYVHKEADLKKARDIVVNAKVSRPSVCNALDTVLVDEEVAELFLPMLQEGFRQYQVEVFADEQAYQILGKYGYDYLRQGEERDFGREFLSYACSIRVLKGWQDALEHINTYSSRHSEAIVSENSEICERFLRSVDAAAVYANASTRFTDGGAFGLGAEIGISTQKLHARGPFALEKLITEKWVVRGNGHTR